MGSDVTGRLKASDPDRGIVLRAITGLGTTQVIGWGTSFSPLAIFGNTIGQDLGLARELVFAGIAVMLLVSALIAPYTGRLVDRLGARPVMIAGSFVAALAMVLSSVAFDLATWFAAWVVVGIATPMMLANAAMPGLVQVVGPNARRAITGLTLISGLTSTIFLPFNQLLLDTVGWRNAYLIFAALHVGVCAPLHALVLGRRAVSAQMPADGRPSRSLEGLLPPAARRRAFILLAIWSCTEGLITWGLYMQVIDVLKAVGLSGGAAIWVWALVGPSQALARFGELMSGGRHSILITCLGSAVLTSASFLFILPFGVNLTLASLFSVCLGVGHGLFAVARNTLPLTLFGAKEFGSYMGQLMVPQNIVNAIAPILFAAIISRMSPVAALWLSGAAALLGLICVIAVVRYCQPRLIVP